MKRIFWSLALAVVTLASLNAVVEADEKENLQIAGHSASVGL